MNIISLISLTALVILFLFNVWQLLFLHKKTKEETKEFQKWRLGFFVLILSSMTFFIYVTSVINSVGESQTITDGIDTWTQQSNSYKEGINFMPLVSTIYTTQWLMFFIQLLQGFSFFGRERLSGTKRMGEQ